MYLKLESNNPNPRECGEYIEIMNMYTFKSVPVNNVRCFFDDLKYSNEEIVEMYGCLIDTIFYDYGEFQGVLRISEIDEEDILDIEDETNQDIIKFIS